MPDTDKIAAIVLAAGFARRFGSDKLLHPVTLNGVTLPLAAHSLLPWLHTHDSISVIVRPNSQLFCQTLSKALGANHASAIKWVVCADAAQGIAHSISRGVHANIKAAGWLIGLADMPIVPASAITGVRNSLLSGGILSAPFNGKKRGHPVGFSAHYRDELIALSGDTGARQLIERDNSKLVPVQILDDGIFADVDTLADLKLM